MGDLVLCYALERGYYVFLLMLIGGAVLCVSSVTSVVTCVLLVHWLSLLFIYLYSMDVASFFYGVMVHVSGVAKTFISTEVIGYSHIY